MRPVNIHTNFKTREFLFDYAKKMLGIDEQTTKMILKSKGCPLPFDVAHWEVYVRALTGRPTCPICGSLTITSKRQPPVGIVKSIEWLWAFPDAGTCWLHPVHNIAYNVAAGIIVPQLGVDLQKAIAIALGPICEHEKYLIECNPCLHKACRENIERSV